VHQVAGIEQREYAFFLETHVVHTTKDLKPAILTPYERKSRQTDNRVSLQPPHCSWRRGVLMQGSLTVSAPFMA
jgi:hypothetical protein